MIEMETRNIIIIIVVIFVVVLSIIGGTVLLFANLLDLDADVGAIDIMIEGKECNVSAELKFSRDLSIELSSLSLVLEAGEVPVDYIDGRINTVLNEEQFSEIVNNEKARIRGHAEYDSLLGSRSGRDIEEDIDLSFLGDILSSVEIGKTKLSTRFPFITVVDFDLTAEIEREVNIMANNTNLDNDGLAQLVASLDW